MPNETTNADAASIAAQLNDNLPQGVPPVPEGFVNVGKGGPRLSSLREITGLDRYPYAWQDGQRPVWDNSGWSGNSECFLYAVTFDHFKEWVHVYVEGVEAPERERLTLRVGGVYRRRDGSVVEITRHNEGAGYPFSTPHGADYMADGAYYNNIQVSPFDIVEELIDPEPRVGITLVEGCYYSSREHVDRVYGPMSRVLVEGHERFRCMTSYNDFTPDGFFVHDATFTTHDRDLIKPETRIPIGLELSGINYHYFFQEGMIPHRGYTGWRYLGTKVTKRYDHPWIYYGSSGFGSIKSDGQALDGAKGHYFEMIPASPQDDSIESRKARASDKAYGKFWLANATFNNKDSTFSDTAVSVFLNEFVNTVARGRTDSGVICVSATSDPTMGAVLQYDPDTKLYKECAMTWGKIHSAVFADSTDESRRDFVHKLDTVRNESRVTLEWSTVRDTYCTPMAGWNCDDDGDQPSITGSCMEKFCNDDGAGHAVFNIYKDLERNDSLQMIKIYLSGDYVGRAICWKSGSDNAWVMDRVYCRSERGEIPRDVVAELSKFAASNGIVARFSKCCVYDLPEVSPKDIKCSGLTDYSYYPYLDTYRGVNGSGLCADREDCSIVCDNADGEPQEELCEVVDRSRRYPRDEVTWSDYHHEYVHDDDVVYVDGHGDVHIDYTVEDYRGNSILRDEAVALGPDEDEWAHEDDDDLVQVHVGNPRSTFHAIRA